MKPALVFGICAGLLLVGACALRPDQPVLPVFRNRSATAAGSSPLLSTKPLPPEVIQHHGAVAEKVLLIRDLRVVDYPDFDSAPPTSGPANGPWSFSSIVRRAFRQVGARDQDVQDFVDRWRTQLEKNLDVGMKQMFQAVWLKRSSKLELERAPVHLLAVVNRMDLASVDPVGCQNDGQPGKLRGAEIRFVYAALPSPQVDHYLSLIVEFVLPCLSKDDFLELAKDWSGLEALNWCDPQTKCDPDQTYQPRLEKVLSNWTGKSKFVRGRINVFEGGSAWYVREFAFQSKGFVAQNLARQPKISVFQCQNASSDLGKFVAASSVDDILASHYDLPNCDASLPHCLAATNAVINVQSDRDQRAVLTLAPDVPPAARRDDIRAALSINSCTGCHGAETNTEFHQIRQRAQNRPSQLSGFLTGSPDCKPTDQTSLISYCTVQLAASPPTDCKNDRKDRQYNDLLRRHLFLYTVLHDLSSSADDATWKSALENSVAHQSH